jgi:hypothetical protein
MNWTDAREQLKLGSSIKSPTNPVTQDNCYIKHFDFPNKYGNTMKRAYQVNPDTNEVLPVKYDDIKDTTDWAVV